MAFLSVFCLPKLISDETVLSEYSQRMRALRLKGLQTDPGSFVSRYETESVQPPEFWTERLQDPTAHSLVMIHSDQPVMCDDLDALLREEWVAFVVLIEAKKISARMIEREGADNSSTQDDWFMAAVYVDTPVRGKGAGRRLIQAAIDRMRDELRKSGTPSATCVTSVMHGNDKALALYMKMGFEIIDVDAIETKEGRSYHTTKLRLHL